MRKAFPEHRFMYCSNKFVFNRSSVNTEVQLLVKEGDALKRKQKLLNMDDALIDKEEELSQRSKELESYEKEVNLE